MIYRVVYYNKPISRLVTHLEFFSLSFENDLIRRANADEPTTIDNNENVTHTCHLIIIEYIALFVV